MLPLQQLPYHTTSQASLSPFAAYPFLPVQDPFHQGIDPNSPELFKQNIQLAQEHVARLQDLSQNALVGLQNAYRVGNGPSQTENDLVAIKQTLAILTNLLRQTGIGALPLIPLPGNESMPTQTPDLKKIGADTSALFEMLRRRQESAATVANLLADGGTRVLGGK